LLHELQRRMQGRQARADIPRRRFTIRPLKIQNSPLNNIICPQTSTLESRTEIGL
jgi:hypothetical protein